LAGEYPSVDTIETENHLESKNAEEKKKFHRMAKLDEFLEM